MKLILTSNYTFLLKYGYDLTGIPKEQMKIAHIITATKGKGAFNPKYKMIIEENGYKLDSFDIEGKTEEEIRNFLNDKNIIQMEGGSTFYLLKVIRETGFGKILKEQLEKGKVYIGTSAGAYIMCPTIEVSSWNENQDFFGVVDFTALNYVPFVLYAHYKDEEKEFVKNKIQTLKYPIHILRDEEGMFCEDGTCRFVAGREETKL